jgi:predicted RNase H-like HicB family nuclease
MPSQAWRIAVLFHLRYVLSMEHNVNLHIEKLPEGVYLATCGDVPGLVAQGRTIAETIEIARDIAKKLIEAQGEKA